MTDLTLSRLIGTLKNTFKINRLTIDASALTAARICTFQNRNGIIADDTDLALKASIASPIFTGNITANSANVSLELGSNTANSPLIDFHSSANTIDYDSRIIAGGGISSAGNGNLVFNAKNLIFNSSISIGASAASAGISFENKKNIAGAAISYGMYLNAAIQSDATTGGYGYATSLSTQATAFTLPELRHFNVAQETIGAGSTVTYQFGFNAAASLTGATNNLGFRSALAAGTGVWNFFAFGTAANYFAGDMQYSKTITAVGTNGAQTINKTTGTVNFAAAATSLVVTNNLVATTSIIICTVGTNDATMKSVAAVAAAGSFTIFPDAAPTSATRVNFMVTN